MRFRLSPLPAAVLAALSLNATAGQTREATVEQQTVEVSGNSLDTEQSGAYRLPGSDSATGLSLTPRGRGCKRQRHSPSPFRGERGPFCQLLRLLLKARLLHF